MVTSWPFAQEVGVEIGDVGYDTIGIRIQGPSRAEVADGQRRIRKLPVFMKCLELNKTRAATDTKALRGSPAFKVYGYAVSPREIEGDPGRLSGPEAGGEEPPPVDG